MPTTPAYPYVFTDITTPGGVAYRGGYCSVLDVTALFVAADLDTKVLTNTAMVETAIADTASEIDRDLQIMYLVPISGNDAVTYLNYCNKHLAASELLDAMADAADMGQGASLASAIVHREKAAMRLDDIKTGAVQLFDAQSNPNGEQPAFPAGIAATWSPEADPGPLGIDPRATSGLFGTRQPNPLRTLEWIQ